MNIQFSRPFYITLGALVIAGAALATGVWALADSASSQQQHLTVPELIEVAKPNLDDRQAEIVADGVITLDEYNGAMESVAQCIEAAGLGVHRLPGRGVGGALQMEVEGDLRLVSDAEATRIHMGCFERYAGSLNMIWAEQNRPTAAQQRAAENDFDVCVIANGQPQLAGDHGEKARPGVMSAGSREQMIYFACRQNGPDWRAPAE